MSPTVVNLQHSTVVGGELVDINASHSFQQTVGPEVLGKAFCRHDIECLQALD